jgi:hypothetical protein
MRRGVEQIVASGLFGVTFPAQREPGKAFAAFSLRAPGARRPRWTLPAVLLAGSADIGLSVLRGGDWLRGLGETGQESTRQTAQEPSSRCVRREPLSEDFESICINRLSAPRRNVLWSLSAAS